MLIKQLALIFILYCSLTNGFQEIIQDHAQQPNKVAKYDTKLGQMLQAFSLSSFCNDSQLESWTCGEICTQFPGMYDIAIIEDKDNDNKGFIGYYQPEKAIVIVWRGTLNLSSWVEDFDAFQTQYPYCTECEVHEGFYKAYQGLEEQFWTEYQNLTQKYPKAKLYLTGYSVGAALSTLNAADLVSRGIKDFTFYNFGSPRVGNQNFASWLQNTLVQNLYRITHNKDPIPHLPPKSFGYWHLAEEVFYVDQSAPNDEHILCDMSGEDPNCADQYGIDILAIGDHVEYMGYDSIPIISKCLI